MEYLFFGLEYSMIKKEINDIKNKYNIDDINVSYYDLNKDTFKSIIDDAYTLSLFSDKKMIICDNSNIFTSSSNEIEQDGDLVLNYLNNSNENTILIFIVNNEKLDERKKVTKAIKNKKEFNKMNTDSLIKDKLKDYKISNEAISLFKERVGTNTGIISNELDKLMMYKYDEKEITEKDIKDATIINYELDIFKLIEYIVNKDKEKAIILYREMLKINEEPIKIIITLANQFRLIYQVKTYSKQNYSESEIASLLKVHPYRVKLAKEKSRSYKEDDLINYLHNLSIMDNNIKSGLTNKEIALELFILEV
jgi:DNA polymerase III subunit delta